MSEWLNRIICGDCLEILKMLPDKSVDLVITDPFYVPKVQFDWKNFDDFYWGFNRQWLTEVKRVVKDDYHLLVSFASADMYQFEGLLREMGFDIKSRIVWNYRNSAKGTAKGTVFAKTYEFIFHCSSGKPLNFSEVWDDKRFDVQTIAIPQSNFTKDKKIHQYQKPLQLWKQLIEICSLQGETVLDPFIGSGTTAVAAKELGRNYIGIEINPEYVEMAQSRLDKVTATLFTPDILNN